MTFIPEINYGDIIAIVVGACGLLYWCWKMNLGFAERSARNTAEHAKLYGEISSVASIVTRNTGILESNRVTLIEHGEQLASLDERTKLMCRRQE